MTDPGNEDNHYFGAYQPIDLYAEFPISNFYICTAIKYVFRHRQKGHNEDLAKATWYLNRLAETDFHFRICDIGLRDHVDECVNKLECGLKEKYVIHTIARLLTSDMPINTAIEQINTLRELVYGEEKKR